EHTQALQADQPVLSTEYSVLGAQSSAPLTTSLPHHLTTPPPHHPATLAQSYRHCEALARREAGNFYHAFRLLPRALRRAMSALYAFMPISDDVADGPEETVQKHAALKMWRHQLDRALEGDYTHPLHPAFHHTVETYAIPRAYFDAVLDG